MRVQLPFSDHERFVRRNARRVKPRGQKRFKGGGGTNTTVTSSGPPAEVLANYQQIYGQARGVAAQQYQPYDGSLIAGFTPLQQAGFNNISPAAQAGSPFLNSASDYTISGIPSANSYLQNASALTGQGVTSGQSYLDMANALAQNASNVGDPWFNQASGLATNAFSAAQPYYDSANNFSQMSGMMLDPSHFAGTVAQYQSPYTQSVVDATQAQFNNQNAIAQNQLAGNMASRGAFGGDRDAIARAVLSGQQSSAQAPVIAGLYNTGFQNATSAAQAGSWLANAAAGQQANLGTSALTGNLSQAQQIAGIGNQLVGSRAQGSQLMAGLGNASANQNYNAAQLMSGLGGQYAGLNFNTAQLLSGLSNQAQLQGLTGANAQLTAGGMQQAQAQNQLNIPYQSYLAAQGYPVQMTNWLSGLALGTGSASGGVGSTTSPGASPISQVAGLATTGVGLYGMGKTAGLWGGSAAADAAADWGSSSAAAFGGSAAADGVGEAAAFIARGGRVAGFSAGGSPGAPDDNGIIPDTSETGISGQGGGGGASLVTDGGSLMGGGPMMAGLGKNLVTDNAPGASLMGDHPMMASTGSTATTSGGSDGGGVIGDIIQLAATAVAAYYGGPAAGAAANTAVGQIRKNFAGGGRVAGMGGIDDFALSHRVAGMGRGYDDGGAVPAGLSASVGGNPVSEQLLQSYSGLPTEQLRELTYRQPAGTAAGQLARKALAMRDRAPQSAPAQPGMSAMAVPQEGAVSGMNGYADGGEPEDDEALPAPFQVASADPTAPVSGMAPVTLPEIAVTPDEPLKNSAGPDETLDVPASRSRRGSVDPGKYDNYVPPPPQIARLIQAAADKYNVRPDVLAWMGYRESGWNPNKPGIQTQSGRGQGLYQFMPGTAKQYGIDPLDTPQAVDGAAHYMRDLLDKTGGDYTAAIQRYGTFSTGISKEDDAAVKAAFQRFIGNPEASGQALAGQSPPTDLITANTATQGTIGGFGPMEGMEQPPPVKSDPWESVLAAGLSMMGGTSPNALTNIGQGGMAGLKNFQQQRELVAKDQLRRDQIQNSALWRAAQLGNQRDRTDIMRTNADPASPKNQAQVDLMRARTAAVPEQLQLRRDQLQLSRETKEKAAERVAARPGNQEAAAINTLAEQSFRDRFGRDPKPDNTDDKTAMADIFMNTRRDQMALTAARRALATGAIPSDKEASSLARLIAEYKEASPPPGQLGTRAARKIMDFVREFNPDYQASRYPQISATVKAFSTGKQGEVINSINNVVGHLHVLDGLAQALQTKDARLINTAQQAFGRHFGIKEPVAFDAAKNIVTAELAKAVIGGEMTEGDRNLFRNTLRADFGPEQMEGAVDVYKNLLAGQLRSRKLQYEDGTGFTKGPFAFENKLLPETKEALWNLVQQKPGATPSASPVAGSGQTAPATLRPAAPSGNGGVASPASEAEYNSLPPNARYRMPNDPPGSYRTKP